MRNKLLIRPSITTFGLFKILSDLFLPLNCFYLNSQRLEREVAIQVQNCMSKKETDQISANSGCMLVDKSTDIRKVPESR